MPLGLDPLHPGFLLGVNLPWLRYGCDFGANAWQPEGGVAQLERQERLREAFAALRGHGLRWVRWFMLCDGRAGLQVSPDGTPRGLDDRFFADADAALSLAADHGLRLMFVLVDFHWFMPAQEVGGVQMRGRADLVTQPRRRAALLDQVIEPILARYGRHPAVWAWDVINEPEWVTRRIGARGRHALAAGVMRGFIADAVAAVRRHTDQRVTVGLVGTRGLGLVQGLDLDFHQFHWYDSVQDQVPLEPAVSALGLERPVLLGEFPTVGSPRYPLALVEAAHRSGYAGALAWSLLAKDTASDPSQSVSTLVSLAREWTAASSRPA